MKQEELNKEILELIEKYKNMEPKTALDNYSDLTKLKPKTKNKFYEACSRENNNHYFVSDEF